MSPLPPLCPTPNRHRKNAHFRHNLSRGRPGIWTPKIQAITKVNRYKGLFHHLHAYSLFLKQVRQRTEPWQHSAKMPEKMSETCEKIMWACTSQTHFCLYTFSVDLQAQPRAPILHKVLFSFEHVRMRQNSARTKILRRAKVENQ